MPAFDLYRAPCDKCLLHLALAVFFVAHQSWDVCAPEAVLKASGGGFTDVNGDALQYPMEYDR